MNRLYKDNTIIRSNTTTYMILRYLPTFHSYRVMDMNHECIKDLPQDLIESYRYKQVLKLKAYDLW